MIENFKFGEMEITFLIDVVLCLIIAFLIGAERESRNKDAGISTHMFVIFGAMLFTFISATVDPASKTRIAAQIVTGIGFLGAGLIIKEGFVVKNLTTAASIWFAAAIGMAVGFGYYVPAIIATVIAIIIPRVPHIKYKHHQKNFQEQKHTKHKNNKHEKDNKDPSDELGEINSD